MDEIGGLLPFFELIRLAYLYQVQATLAGVADIFHDAAHIHFIIKHQNRLASARFHWITLSVF